MWACGKWQSSSDIDIKCLVCILESYELTWKFKNLNRKNSLAQVQEVHHVTFKPSGHSSRFLVGCMACPFELRRSLRRFLQVLSSTMICLSSCKFAVFHLVDEVISQLLPRSWACKSLVEGAL